MIRRFVPMTLILGLFAAHRNLLWRGHTGSRRRQPVPPEFGMIVIETPGATIHGERNEVYIRIGIDDPAIRSHDADFGVV